MTGVKDDHEEGDGVCGIKNDDGGQQDGRDYMMGEGVVMEMMRMK